MTGAMVAWRAFRPSTWWKAALLSTLKPLYLFLASAAAALRRTLLPSILGFATLTIGRWERQWSIWHGPFLEHDICGP